MAAVAADRDRAPGGSSRNTVTSVVVRLVLAATALWAVMCGVGYVLTHPLKDTSVERSDGSVDRFLARHRSEPWTTLTHLLSFAADTYTVIGVGLVLFLGMRVHLGRWRESAFLFAALAGEVLVFVCTTSVIDRHRPAVPHLDEAPPTSSFPSGHTAAACTLYGALAVIALCASTRAWLRTLAVILAVVAPVSVAFARLYRGMHFPTDVIGGAVLALTWLAITFVVIERQRR